MKIVIVEDERDLASLLALKMRKEGFDVTVAYDGATGLREILRLRPDLVILDLDLPLMPGEEVCRAVRDSDDEDVSNIPIIIATGKSTDVDRIVGKVLGASSYMTKPIRMSEMMREIYEILNTGPDNNRLIPEPA